MAAPWVHNDAAHEHDDVYADSTVRIQAAHADIESAEAGPDEIVRMIDANGGYTPHPEYAPYIAGVGDDQLRRRYRDLVAVRRIDEEATALARQGELGLWAPLLGQEAAQVGSARALRTDDFAFCSYREHGVAHCRGVGPGELLSMWRGVTHSGWDPFRHSITTPAIIVGTQGLHATGYAMGLKLDGSSAAAIAYFGDGATSQGDIAEALGFAASFGAPVVFFCQNNQWAISEPVSRQTRVPIADRGRGYGLASVRVDGNDVLAVEAVTRAALAHTRADRGPVLIEAVTYRRGPHTTSDDPRRYRSAELDEQWRAQDPLHRMRAFLDARGLIDDDYLAQVHEHAEQIAAELRESCLSMPDPAPSAMFDHVYTTPHRLLDEERAEFLAYLDRNGGV